MGKLYIVVLLKNGHAIKFVGKDAKRVINQISFLEDPSSVEVVGRTEVGEIAMIRRDDISATLIKEPRV